MIWMYLTKEVKGAYSRIQYGVPGDRVAILKYDNHLCQVLHESGYKFYCNFDLLSKQKIQKVNVEEKTKKKRV